MLVQTSVNWFVTIALGEQVGEWGIRVSRGYNFTPDKEKFYQAKAERAMWLECGSEDDVLQRIQEMFGNEAIILKMIRGEVTDRIEDL